MLVDTNILAVLLQPQHPMHEAAKTAVERMVGKRRLLHVLTQNLVELWVVLTRPSTQNGLGLSPAEAAKELQRIKEMFTLLPDTPSVFGVWEALVLHYSVSGKPTHDARLVAGMRVYGLTSILTFDAKGFTRFAGIEVIDPSQITLDVLRVEPDLEGC